MIPIPSAVRVWITAQADCPFGPLRHSGNTDPQNTFTNAPNLLPPTAKRASWTHFLSSLSWLGAMRNILAATVLMISVGTASAADMQAVPYAPYTRALPYFSPIYSWTGFYIGAMGGYGWSDELRASIGGQT